MKRKTRYTSALTPAGNSSYSRTSQEEADKRAAALDAKGCVDCIDCVACVDCENCKGCVNCADCTDCTDCTDCDDCENCTNVLQLAGEFNISRG
jgi:hypothetical protein